MNFYLSTAGCQRFGHSCFGAHGKRAEIPGGGGAEMDAANYLGTGDAPLIPSYYPNNRVSPYLIDWVEIQSFKLRHKKLWKIFLWLAHVHASRSTTSEHELWQGARIAGWGVDGRKAKEVKLLFLQVMMKEWINSFKIRIIFVNRL
jgi:hypothetical protein